jgi:arylsulfatase A-like enzyme
MGIRDGRWKYIVRTSDSYEELYDIEKDPAEKTNIADKHPEVTARYRKIVFLSRSYKDEYYRRMLADYPKGGDAAAAGELNR